MVYLFIYLFCYQVAAHCSFIAVFHFFSLTTIFRFIARYFAGVEESLLLVTLEIADANPYMENPTCPANSEVEDLELKVWMPLLM